MTWTKNRETNFELLRLLAVLMILILHVNQHFGDDPVSYIANNPIDAFFQELFDVFAIVGVNVFVLISGWFGIRPSTKGFINLIYQIVFITFISWIIVKLLGLSDDGFRPFYGVIWFIYAYLLLYILSPLLNGFITYAEKEEYRSLLIGFFVFMTLFGWVLPLNGGFDDGYSTMSFMFLYLLSRYLHIYCFNEDTKQFRFRFNKVGGGGILYIVISLILTVATLWFVANDFHGYGMRIKIVNYINPLVIFNSVLLLAIFASLKIRQNKYINYIASSSFAIILLHTSPFIIEPTYYGISKDIFDENSGLAYLCRISCFILVFLFGGVLLDQLRIISWHYLNKWFNKNNRK